MTKKQKEAVLATILEDVCTDEECPTVGCPKQHGHPASCLLQAALRVRRLLEKL